MPPSSTVPPGITAACRRTLPLLFVSTPVNALVEGIYEENVSLAEVLTHGDFGIGTFNDLDGEMVIVDGIAYQMGADGTVRQAGRDVLTPYACVTFFRPLIYDDIDAPLSPPEFDSFLESLIPSPNVVYAVRVEGEFHHIRVRSVPKQENYRPLVEVAREQPEFMHHSVRGTLAGFFTPQFLASVTVPGFHLHFIRDDRQAGGHLLECSIQTARVFVQNLGGMELRLPYTLDYVTADLSRDSSDDLDEIEH